MSSIVSCASPFSAIILYSFSSTGVPHRETISWLLVLSGPGDAGVRLLVCLRRGDGAEPDYARWRRSRVKP